MTDDVLEEWQRLAERIAHVPTYEFGEPFAPWEQEERERARWYTTNSADGKPVQTTSQIRNGAHL